MSYHFGTTCTQTWGLPGRVLGFYSSSDATNFVVALCPLRRSGSLVINKAHAWKIKDFPLEFKILATPPGAFRKMLKLRNQDFPRKLKVWAKAPAAFPKILGKSRIFFENWRFWPHCQELSGKSVKNQGFSLKIEGFGQCACSFPENLWKIKDFPWKLKVLVKASAAFLKILGKSRIFRENCRFWPRRLQLSRKSLENQGFSLKIEDFSRTARSFPEIAWKIKELRV